MSDPVNRTARELGRVSIRDDPALSNLIAEVVSAAPAGASAGLVVRPIGQVSLEAATVSHLDADAAIAASPVVTGTTTPLRFRSRLYGTGGTTWDRIRAGLGVDGNVPTGILSSQLMGLDAVALAYDRIRSVADNVANPTAGKLPVLPARANAAAPAWTEGNVVPLSVDLAGVLRTTGSYPYTRALGFLNVYSFSLVDAPGVAAANRFLSIFNPVASGRTLVLLSVEVLIYSVAIASTKNSLRLARTTAASVGTLQLDSAVNEWVVADTDPVAEVRTANPTVTVSREVTAFKNLNITAAGSLAVSRQIFRPGDFGWGEFTLVPGEGAVLYQTIAGNVAETYDLMIIWAER